MKIEIFIQEEDRWLEIPSGWNLISPIRPDKINLRIPYSSEIFGYFSSAPRLLVIDRDTSLTLNFPAAGTRIYVPGESGLKDYFTNEGAYITKISAEAFEKTINGISYASPSSPGSVILKPFHSLPQSIEGLTVFVRFSDEVNNDGVVSAFQTTVNLSSSSVELRDGTIYLLPAGLKARQIAFTYYSDRLELELWDNAGARQLITISKTFDTTFYEEDNYFSFTIPYYSANSNRVYYENGGILDRRWAKWGQSDIFNLSLYLLSGSLFYIVFPKWVSVKYSGPDPDVIEIEGVSPTQYLIDVAYSRETLKPALISTYTLNKGIREIAGPSFAIPYLSVAALVPQSTADFAPMAAIKVDYKGSVPFFASKEITATLDTEKYKDNTQIYGSLAFYGNNGLISRSPKWRVDLVEPIRDIGMNFVGDKLLIAYTGKNDPANEGVIYFMDVSGIVPEAAHYDSINHSPDSAPLIHTPYSASITIIPRVDRVFRNDTKISAFYATVVNIKDVNYKIVRRIDYDGSIVSETDSPPWAPSSSDSMAIRAYPHDKDWPQNAMAGGNWFYLLGGADGDELKLYAQRDYLYLAFSANAIKHIIGEISKGLIVDATTSIIDGIPYSFVVLAVRNFFIAISFPYALSGPVSDQKVLIAYHGVDENIKNFITTEKWVIVYTENKIIVLDRDWFKGKTFIPYTDLTPADIITAPIYITEHNADVNAVFLPFAQDEIGIWDLNTRILIPYKFNSYDFFAVAPEALALRESFTQKIQRFQDLTGVTPVQHGNLVFQLHEFPHEYGGVITITDSEIVELKRGWAHRYSSIWINSLIFGNPFSDMGDEAKVIKTTPALAAEWAARAENYLGATEFIEITVLGTRFNFKRGMKFSFDGKDWIITDIVYYVGKGLTKITAKEYRYTAL